MNNNYNPYENNNVNINLSKDNAMETYFAYLTMREKTEQTRITETVNLQLRQIELNAKLEKEKLMTHDERLMKQQIKSAKWYAESLTEWSNNYCSCLTPKIYRQEIENKLYARTAVEFPEKVSELDIVIKNPVCGYNRFDEIHRFLSSFKYK
jgi:hypothetical protein